MRVLLVTYHETDCGLDLIYDGLCRVLGPQDVYEYPEKPFLHGKQGRRWSWFPLFFHWPVYANDDEKLQMLKDGKFDLVLFSTRVYQLLKTGYKAEITDKYSRVFEIIQSKDVPVFILDMNDGAVLEEELIQILNARLYFKRDYMKGWEYDSKVIPLCFGYSEKYIPANIDTERTNTVFWLGRSYCGRTKYLKALRAISPESEIIGTGRNEIICGQEEYSKKLLNHKIGLNLFGYGYGDLRYFELPAHGMLLVTRRLPIHIEYDYTDGVNVVFFEDVNDMKNKVKYCLEHESFVDRARISGHEWMMKYHTTRARASQMLDKIKAVL